MGPRSRKCYVANAALASNVADQSLHKLAVPQDTAAVSTEEEIYQCQMYMSQMEKNTVRHSCMLIDLMYSLQERGLTLVGESGRMAM